MKKRWITVMASALCAAMLCGCGGNADNVSEQSSSQSGEVQSNDTSNAAINATDYVTLGEYKGQEVSVPAKTQYEDADYDLGAKSAYFSYVVETQGVTDRPVALYDMTNIDYEGKKDGVAFEGGTAKGATLLIGSHQFIDGFEEGLVGVKPGETVDLNLTFPEGYGNAELAGQDVVFTVTVNFIPEMKDERIAELGVEGVTTVDGFKQYIKENMDAQAESDYKISVGNAVIQKVVDNSQFVDELPQELMEENRAYYENYLNQMGASYGMDGRTYVSVVAAGQDYETLVTEVATQYTKEDLLMQAIAEKEGLIPSDEEVDTRMAEYAASIGYTVDDLLVQGVTRENYKRSFMSEDVLNFLMENTVIKDIQ